MPELPLNVIHQLRYMQTKEAEEFLSELGVSSEDVESLRPIIGRSVPIAAAPDPRGVNSDIAQEAVIVARHGIPNYPRRMLIATLWLLGASNNKIAIMLHVTTQTIFAQINKMLPMGNERHAMRLNGTLSYEAAEWYMQQWLANAHELGSMSTPLQMAKWLKENHPYVE